MSQRWGLRHPAQQRRLRAAAAGLLPGGCPAAAAGAGLTGVAKLLSGTGMVASWILRAPKQTGLHLMQLHNDQTLCALASEGLLL